MDQALLSIGSAFQRALKLLRKGAALVVNSWSNRRAAGILDSRIAALDLDRVGKVVVYTAIFGGKDELLDAPRFPNVEFVCFTDDRTLTSATWKIVIVASGVDPRLAAKIYKVLPHRFFPEHEYSLWIDGTHLPAVDPRYLVRKYLEILDIALFAHHARHCIYDEMQACIRYGKGNEGAIQRQEEIYRTEGYPANNGLATCTVILRRHHTAQVRRTMEDWWAEINRHSIRDQLSFNYVAHRHKLIYATIPGNVYENHFFRVTEHRQPDRSALSIGWILNGSEETASARLMGYNMHAYFVSQGVRSKILFSPERRYAASINLEMEQIDEILRHNINLLVIVKLDSGRALNYLILRCRQLGIKLVYAACDLPLCGKLAESADGIVCPSREFAQVVPGRHREKLWVVFDGYEHDGSAHKIHGSDRRLKLCLVTNRVWDRVPCLRSLPDGVSLKIIGPNPETLAALFPKSKVFRESPFAFEYVSWSRDGVMKEILACDAGIVPWPRIDRNVRVKSANRLVLFMSLGLPVVASPVPSFGKIVRQGENGFLATTEREWQESVISLRDDPARRARMSETARMDVVPRFSSEKQGECYREAFTRILQS